MIFLQILALIIFGIAIMLPIYINLFKDKMFIEFEERLKKEEKLKHSNCKKGN